MILPFVIVAFFVLYAVGVLDIKPSGFAEFGHNLERLIVASTPFQMLRKWQYDDIFTAIMETRFDDAMDFLSYNPSLATTADEWGNYPLYYAIDRGCLPLVRELVEKYKSDVNYNRPLGGWSYLHVAVATKQTETVKYLLAHGVNPLVKDKSMSTPLDLARFHGLVEIIDMLETYTVEYKVKHGIPLDNESMRNPGEAPDPQSADDEL